MGPPRCAALMENKKNGPRFLSLTILSPRPIVDSMSIVAQPFRRLRWSMAKPPSLLKRFGGQPALVQLREGRRRRAGLEPPREPVAPLDHDLGAGQRPTRAEEGPHRGGGSSLSPQHAGAHREGGRPLSLCSENRGAMTRRNKYPSEPRKWPVRPGFRL